MDAEVCACLKSQLANFDAEKYLRILEMEDQIGVWHQEYARRETKGEFSVLQEVFGSEALILNASYTAPAATGFPDPVDAYGLIPSPISRAEDTPQSSQSSSSLDAAGGVPLKNASIAGEKPKAEGMSKTQKRNAGRRRAKARAKEAAGENNPAGDNEDGLE